MCWSGRCYSMTGFERGFVSLLKKKIKFTKSLFISLHHSSKECSSVIKIVIKVMLRWESLSKLAPLRFYGLRCKAPSYSTKITLSLGTLHISFRTFG